MSVFGGLHIGRSGLGVAQRALETAAHNVANANTEGYSRQRISTSTLQPIGDHRELLGPGTTGQGVQVDAVSRATDQLVLANLRHSSGQAASWESRAEYFNRAEAVLGTLDGGVSTNLDDFFNSWEALSQSPESKTSRDLVLDAGRTLTQSLNDAHTRLTNLGNEVALDMQATVAQVNDLASDIATLNAQIKSSRAQGDTPNDLLDRRDLALNQLAALTGAQASIEQDGDARVTINNMPLVDEHNAGSFSVSGVPPTVVWDASGSPAALSGELGSLVEIAGPVTADLIGQLNEIATELRDVVNGAHQVGFGLDGVDGRDFFAGSDASDLRVDSSLTTDMVAASATGTAADGNHALVLGGLRSAVGAAGESIGELIRGMQGVLGLEASHAERQRDLAEIVVADSNRLVAETSGVSVDEELTAMLQWQRAYEASARVITVIDQMLDKLINGTGSTR